MGTYNYYRQRQWLHCAVQIFFCLVPVRFVRRRLLLLHGTDMQSGKGGAELLGFLRWL